MKTSPPARNTIARKPSHFGSIRNVPPSAGSSSVSLANIGSMGGTTGNDAVMPFTYATSSFQGRGGARNAPCSLSPDDACSALRGGNDGFNGARCDDHRTVVLHGNDGPVVIT